MDITYIPMTRGFVYLVAVSGADALVLVTEWKQYWVPDYDRLSKEMRQKILVDGRNIWPQEVALGHGFTCRAIGRQTVG